jgi:hypothetical protein
MVLILQLGTLSLRVQFLDVFEESRAGEILRTNQLSPDDAALVDDVGFGELEASVELVGSLVLIEDGEQVDMLPGHIMLVIREGFVACDGHYLDLGHLLLKGLQAGHFFDAGSAPAGPEIEHDDFALKTLQIDGVLSVVDGEYRGFQADLVGKSASIATGCEGAEY